MKPSEMIAKAVEEFYKSDYENIVMSGGFLKRYIVRKTHLEIERFALNNSKDSISILELGAQADQHRSFVKINYHTYIVSDINFKPLITAKQIYDLKRIKQNTKMSPDVKFEQIDASKINYPGETFDRIVATCLIVHLDNPIDALHEWRRVMKDNGQIDFYVPCDPGLLLRMARNLVHKWKKLSVNYPFDLLLYSDHKSHYLAINQFINFTFSNDNIKRRFFPFRFFPWGFNLWAVYSIRIIKN
jgi:SAM-dependent methyltransferase